MTKQRSLTDKSAAIDRAIQITGFHQLAEMTSSAQQTVITRDETPFLRKQVIGRRTWQIEFNKVSLRLKSASSGFQDTYRRRFFVLLDENTGQLLSIQSRFEGEAPDMHPEPAGALAEAQLTAESETYLGLPTEDPKIDFLTALDAVLSKGIGSPFLAKEIQALYITETRLGGIPRAVWVVTLRGLPPIPAHGPYGDQIPIWQRNHMRNVVDAATGDVLFATNSPQPGS